MFGAFAAEAYRVDGDVTGSKRAEDFVRDASCVVVAIGEQDYGADGEVGGFFGQLLEGVAQPGGGGFRVEVGYDCRLRAVVLNLRDRGEFEIFGLGLARTPFWRALDGLAL